eukprot:SAG31_NODE_3043_length_4753_cov_3.006016_6_plen_49_part_01
MSPAGGTIVRGARAVSATCDEIDCPSGCLRAGVSWLRIDKYLYCMIDWY